jgi:hypothetical protein
MLDEDREPPHSFREWAEDPENQEAVDRLAAHFLADDGVEMVTDLLMCRGEQHQWEAERWMRKLQERFDRWWADGRPRLSDTPRVSVSYWTPTMEREARQLLAAHLPPGAGFSITQRWRRLAAGAVEPDGWACDVQDGRASAMGRGDTPVAAAQRAVDAWREFVTGHRVELPLAEDEVAAATERPPKLVAPSAGKSAAADDAGRKAV